MLGINQHGRHAEHLRGRQLMDIVAPAERLCQQGIFREVRQQPQLNLRIIGREQRMSWLSNKRRANFAPQLGADGNILQVWISRREPSRRRAGLVERGVHPLCLRVNQYRQRINISAL